MPGGENAAPGCSAGNVSGLLAHSSSQSEDRDQHSCGEVAMAPPMSTGLLQAKAQDPSGLLACLEQLAAGGLAKMLEILCGAGIGGEDFEHRTGCERLQRPPRLQHRAAAKKPGRIEGGVHRHVAACVILRHLGRTKL